ncbi:MAG: hypothetical protein KAS18_05035 [Calditrichia bacterium]|nr:hypothetical protein [Calditrichia bacterium]
MEYCPHCSAALSKENFKKCPYCKKNIDMDDWAAVVEPGESSEKNKDAIRKIWFREHSSKIIPVITLMVGFIIGAILLYSYAQLQFANEKSEYQNTISTLNETISQKDANAGNEKTGFENIIKNKDGIISILAEQKDILANIINFTRRMSRNSTITLTTANEADYFKRNFSYLANQFNKQKEALEQTEFKSTKDYNLKTMPQITGE